MKNKFTHYYFILERLLFHIIFSLPVQHWFNSLFIFALSVQPDLFAVCCMLFYLIIQHSLLHASCIPVCINYVRAIFLLLLYHYLIYSRKNPLLMRITIIERTHCIASHAFYTSSDTACAQNVIRQHHKPWKWRKKWTSKKKNNRQKMRNKKKCCWKKVNGNCCFTTKHWYREPLAIVYFCLITVPFFSVSLSTITKNRKLTKK